MGHIELSRSADLLVVAPATADLMAKMATGMANDLATTALLATDKPVLIAPAMNVRMWNHPATQRNLATAERRWRARCAGPTRATMACGEYGPGRMAEPAEIRCGDRGAFRSRQAQDRWPASKVLVTAGPTHEPIDPVRYIANRSSGKQGYAIAAAAAALGAETVLVSGPVDLPPPAGVKLIRSRRRCRCSRRSKAELPADIAIFAAAVADWRIERIAAPEDQEAAERGGAVAGARRESRHPADHRHGSGKRPPLVVGFAAETENVVANARAKLERKGCDLIVANDVSADSGVTAV